jgi:predicted acylesterase/phospholipase RssA
MISTLKTCGFLSSATQQTYYILAWKFMTRVMHGDSSVSSVLWNAASAITKFIGASMSLVGLLPPLCDNGHMLVDGGYMDNLPVNVYRAI